MLRRSLLLAWLVAILGILAPSIASGATTANLETRVKGFELVVPTLIGRSTARTPEKHPEKSNAYDEIASGSPLAAEGAAGAEAGGGMRLFRIITEATPEANVTSNAARGAAARGPEIANPALHQGVSMFDSVEGAASRVQMLQRGGKTVHGIGEFSVPPGGAPGVSVQKTLGPGHYTVSGAPEKVMQFWDWTLIRW